jgi:pyruvate dehydrogenase E2 component (dihydrolipoamide acetyltransferase)
MATEIKIPIPDQTTEEVRIVKWLKQEGDAVAKGEVVLEVETDKSVIEVEAIGAGQILKRLYGEDDMVPVGRVVGHVGEAGEEIAVSSQQPAGVGATPQAGAVEAQKEGLSESGMMSPALQRGLQETHAGADVSEGRIKASPIARKLAAQRGLDLSTIKGTGPNGRIVREDVEKYVEAPERSVPVGPVARGEGGRILASPNARRLGREMGIDLNMVKGTGAGGRITGQDVRNFEGLVAEVATGQPLAGTEVTVTKMRRAIGLNLQMSSRDVPHFNVTMSIDMGRAMRLRKELNQTRENSERVSVNDLVIKAVAEALKHYPAVNSRFTGEKLIYLPDINVGVATAVPDGLVVPVLVGADKRGWSELAVETKRLAQQARMGKIIGAGKGTFTVSNLGMFGVDNFTAIINPPESAILAVGAVKEEVVAIEGNIGVRLMMKVTLCSDHRVVDGALAAEFLRYIKVYLEEEIK